MQPYNFPFKQVMDNFLSIQQEQFKLISEARKKHLDTMLNLSHQYLDGSIEKLTDMKSMMEDGSHGFKSDVGVALIQNAIDNRHHLKSKLSHRVQGVHTYKQNIRRLAMGVFALLNITPFAVNASSEVDACSQLQAYASRTASGNEVRTHHAEAYKAKDSLSLFDITNSKTSLNVASSSYLDLKRQISAAEKALKVEELKAAVVQAAELDAALKKAGGGHGSELAEKKESLRQLTETFEGDKTNDSLAFQAIEKEVNELIKTGKDGKSEAVELLLDFAEYASLPNDIGRTAEKLIELGPEYASEAERLVSSFVYDYDVRTPDRFLWAAEKFIELGSDYVEKAANFFVLFANDSESRIEDIHLALKKLNQLGPDYNNQTANVLEILAKHPEAKIVDVDWALKELMELEPDYNKQTANVLEILANHRESKLNDITWAADKLITFGPEYASRIAKILVLQAYHGVSPTESIIAAAKKLTEFGSD